MPPDRSIIPEAEARKAARLMVQLLRLPLQAMPPDMDPSKTMRLMQLAIEEPDKAENELVAHFMRGEITSERFAADLAELESAIQSPRRAIGEVTKQLPPGPPGRRTTTTGSPAEYAAFAADLLPFVLVLVRERIRSKRRPLREAIEYLGADFPAQAAYAIEHLDRFTEAFEGNDQLRGKTVHGRAKAITYILTGNEFGMKRGYALRQVRAAVNRLPKRT